jgi:hypothetical protein
VPILSGSHNQTIHRSLRRSDTMPRWLPALDALGDDDAAVAEFGIELCPPNSAKELLRSRGAVESTFTR